MSEAKVTQASEALLSFLRDTLGSAPEQLFAGAPLRSHLDQVRGRIETAEAEMVEVVSALRPEMETTFALGESVAERLRQLRGGLESVGHEALQQRLQGISARRGRLREEIASAQSVSAVLQALSRMHVSLEGFDAALEAGRLGDASVALRSASASFGGLCCLGVADKALLGLLRERTGAARESLAAAAAAAWEEAGGGGEGGGGEGGGREGGSLRLLGCGVGGRVAPSILRALHETGT
ncbi:hypothetical protein EMIHUDRAFT_255605, partial [Emiliania huxleyi CCMP1516]|uniref:Uncharacterized protein n=2 Tax=Emiliania huxleyi TaxID=2903 RepID=A0A0D3J892_EMIH1